MKIYEIIIFGLWGIWRSHLPPVQSGRTGLSEEGVFPLRKINPVGTNETQKKNLSIELIGICFVMPFFITVFQRFRFCAFFKGYRFLSHRFSNIVF